jgi:hypothetical protein
MPRGLRRLGLQIATYGGLGVSDGSLAIMILAEISLAQGLEAGMLLCFGIAWPVDIYKTLRTRHVAGKSIGFMLIVLLGYVCGMGAKFYRVSQGEPPEAVTWLYAVNSLLVSVDILVYLHFRQRAASSV